MTFDSTPDSLLAGARTILVVDDVGVVRKAAFRLLSEAGYRVFEAESVTEALLMDRVVTALRGHPEHDVKASRTHSPPLELIQAISVRGPACRRRPSARRYAYACRQTPPS